MVAVRLVPEKLSLWPAKDLLGLLEAYAAASCLGKDDLSLCEPFFVRLPTLKTKAFLRVSYPNNMRF